MNNHCNLLLTDSAAHKKVAILPRPAQLICFSGKIMASASPRGVDVNTNKINDNYIFHTELYNTVFIYRNIIFTMVDFMLLFDTHTVVSLYTYTAKENCPCWILFGVCAHFFEALLAKMVEQ